MTKKIKKILSRVSKRHKHTLTQDNKATYAQRLAGLDTTTVAASETTQVVTPAATSESIQTSYPVKKDMILFETLNNIHALFSIPQKN